MLLLEPETFFYIEFSVRVRRLCQQTTSSYGEKIFILFLKEEEEELEGGGEIGIRGGAGMMIVHHIGHILACGLPKVIPQNFI